jgi:hypothetical protein
LNEDEQPGEIPAASVSKAEKLPNPFFFSRPHIPKG